MAGKLNSVRRPGKCRGNKIVDKLSRDCVPGADKSHGKQPGGHLSDCTHHCPFLNRPDHRCARHFHLDHLQHTFGFCFGSYQSCSVYTERFEERQEWRGAGAAPADAARNAQYGSNHATDFGASTVYRPSGARGQSFVPIAIAGRYPELNPGGPRIPDVPRL